MLNPCQAQLGKNNVGWHGREVPDSFHWNKIVKPRKLSLNYHVKTKTVSLSAYIKANQFQPQTNL